MKNKEAVIPARDLTEPLSEAEAKSKWPVLWTYSNGGIKILHRRIVERLKGEEWLDVKDEEWATAVLMFQIKQEHTTLSKHWVGCWHRADCEACHMWNNTKDTKPEDMLMALSQSSDRDGSRLHRAEKLIWMVVLLRRIMFEIAGSLKFETG